MNFNSIKSDINKQKTKKSRTSWLDKNVFGGWLTPHPKLNRAYCIMCNKAIKYRKTDLIRHAQSIAHKENINLVSYPQVGTRNEEVDSVKDLEPTTVKDLEPTTVKDSQPATVEEVYLVEDSQSNMHEEEVVFIEHPEMNTHENEVILVEHPHELNTHGAEIIIIEPSIAHKENKNLVGQLQLITHTEKANAVKHSQSVIHRARPNLVEHSQSVAYQERADLAEPSHSITHKDQANLATHSQSITHKRKSNSVAVSRSVIPIEIANPPNLARKDINFYSHDNKVKQAEIKLSAFLIRHNIPFHALDRLIPLIKDISKSPKVIMDLAARQNECANNTQIIEEDEDDEMIKNLRTCKFSILIDESSNSSKKVICIFVQYVSPQDKKITKEVLKLISVELTDPADRFFEEFKGFLEKKKIPLQNIVAVVSDNASMMTGCSSITSNLKLEIPRLITLNCIGQSSTIIINSAYAHIPQSCERFIQEVVSYIADNMENSTRLSEFKDIFNTETKMILKSSDTKWLVLHKCIVKLADNWITLKNYFIFAAVESKSKTATLISKLFNNDSTKAYLLFLKYSLNFFNNLNDFYQTRRFLSHTLLENSQQLIREVALNFMVPSALEDIVNINLGDQKNILSVNDVYVGPECKSVLRTLPPKRAREIRIQCRDFYATAVFKMLECLPYRDTMFEQLMFLQAKIALYYDDRKKIRDLTSVATCTGHPDITKLAYEWRILPTIYNDTEKEELASLEIDEMWKQILKYKNFDREKMFPNLELLIESVLTFPHSNFETKHILSMVTNIKYEEDEI